MIPIYWFIATPFYAYVAECRNPGQKTPCSVTCGYGQQKTCTRRPEGLVWLYEGCDTKQTCPGKLLT